MAARAYWQGQIRLALVSIPVEIYTATRSGAQIAFHQIHQPSGKRVKYEKTVPGIGPSMPTRSSRASSMRRAVTSCSIRTRSTQSSSNRRRRWSSRASSTRTRSTCSITSAPISSSPADDLAEEAFIVLREALRRTRKVGLGQLAMRGREYVVSLKPCGRGMVLETLRYADEVQKAQGYFRDIPDTEPDAELLELAETLIGKKAGSFDPADFHDRYVDALKGLIERKKKSKGGRIIEEEDEPARRGSNVVDLMAALKQSLEKPGAAKAPARKAAPRKRA